jgi:hypothetical protein
MTNSLVGLLWQIDAGQQISESRIRAQSPREPPD